MPTVTVGITQEHLSDVYSDPYITKVGHDHRASAPINHPNATYLSAWVGDTFAGAFMAIKFSALEIEWHSFLKKTSLPYSRALGKSFLDWAFTANPIARVTAYIIQGLETAKNYGLKLGMKYEGCRRNACLQNGVLKDIYILGITREEWRSA
jgi:RimJ/RimL family protein N-acetyltransferase